MVKIKKDFFMNNQIIITRMKMNSDNLLHLLSIFPISQLLCLIEEQEDTEELLKIFNQYSIRYKFVKDNLVISLSKEQRTILPELLKFSLDLYLTDMEIELDQIDQSILYIEDFIHNGKATFAIDFCTTESVTVLHFDKKRYEIIKQIKQLVSEKVIL